MKKWIRKSVWYGLIVLTVCAGIAVKNVSLADGLATTDDGKFKVSLYNNEYAAMVQYLGTESTVRIPSSVTVGGTVYPVSRLSCNEGFAPNAKVKEVYVPMSISRYDSGVFDGEGGLEKIHVYQTDPYYDFLFDRDGILYADIGSGDIVLVKYPEGRTETQYILPNDVNRLNGCFAGNLKISKLLVSCKLSIKK